MIASPRKNLNSQTKNNKNELTSPRKSFSTIPSFLNKFKHNELSQPSAKLLQVPPIPISNRQPTKSQQFVKLPQIAQKNAKTNIQNIDYINTTQNQPLITFRAKQPITVNRNKGSIGKADPAHLISKEKIPQVKQHRKIPSFLLQRRQNEQKFRKSNALKQVQNYTQTSTSNERLAQSIGSFDQQLPTPTPIEDLPCKSVGRLTQSITLEQQKEAYRRPVQRRPLQIKVDIQEQIIDAYKMNRGVFAKKICSPTHTQQQKCLGKKMPHHKIIQFPKTK